MKLNRYGASALVALVILGMLIAGCTGQDTPATPSVPEAGKPDSAEARTVVEAGNRFACDLYAQLAAESGNTDENIFFSPFSISSALAITYEGARGTTADEIRSTFHFPDNTYTLRQVYYDVSQGLNAGTAAYTLRNANALWAEKAYAFLPGYITAAETWYGAETTNVDFITAPDDARQTINRWVEEQTEEKIRDLLPAGSITPLTRLVITNAIYFKGDWVLQFDKDNTREADFRTLSGTIVRVPMMERTDEEAVYGYAETDALQFLSMPYEHGDGRSLAMIVLLPKGDDLSAIEDALDADYLAGLQDSAAERRVMVWFPKYTLETKYALPDTLGSLGMPTAFTGDADFSGMDGKHDLFISEIIHQAYIDVNEEGTEAAAATGVVVSLSAAPAEPVTQFRADHPFVFAILDDETGAILFMGRVAAP